MAINSKLITVYESDMVPGLVFHDRESAERGEIDQVADVIAHAVPTAIRAAMTEGCDKKELRAAIIFAADRIKSVQVDEWLAEQEALKAQQAAE